MTLWTFLKGTPVVVVKPNSWLSSLGQYEAWVERRRCIVDGTLAYSDDPERQKDKSRTLYESLQPERLDDEQ